MELIQQIPGYPRGIPYTTYTGTFLGFSDYSICSFKSFNRFSSTICLPLVKPFLGLSI
jgi:hypothetical protein